MYTLMIGLIVPDIKITTHVLKLRLQARGELIIWICFMIPALGLLLITIFPIPLIFSLMIIFAIPAELFFRIPLLGTKKIPAEYNYELEKICKYFRKRGCINFSYKYFRYIPNDMNVNGRVIGIFFPKILISAGLLISLKRNESKSFSILAHEMAHISHLDRLNYAYLTRWFINTIIPLIYFLIGSPFITTIEDIVKWIANCTFTFFVCGYFMRERELLADTCAALLVGPKVYAEMLQFGQDSPNQHGGFFHPSLALRLQAINTNPPAGMYVRKKALLVYMIFFIIGIYSALSEKLESCSIIKDGECYYMIEYNYSNATDYHFVIIFGVGQAIVSFFGFGMELFRSSAPIPSDFFKDSIN